ncbi:MAG: hypothetical protein GSR72_00295 [Desulfurococcales archaeon]|nr:hypothetical protein [Desulfurococcales archaeon]
MVTSFDLFTAIFTAYLVFDIQWKLRIEKRLTSIEEWKHIKFNGAKCAPRPPSLLKEN